MPIRAATHVTIVVRDLDAALSWYRNVLGFHKRQDQIFPVGDSGDMGRWLTVGLPGQDVEFVLSPPVAAAGSEEAPRPGGGALVVLACDDLDSTIEVLRDRGVDIVQEPHEESWGSSAIIRDPDGNPFNLVETKSSYAVV